MTQDLGTKFDLIVAGGGPSGVFAALSAARQGIRVLLIERHGFLGGMNTAALVGPIMTFHAGKTQVVRGIPHEVMMKVKDAGGTPGYLVDPIWACTSMLPIDTEIYKTVLLEEAKAAGVHLLLHSFVLDVIKEGSRICGVSVATKEGLKQFSASFFVDATGDGDLAARAGCAFTHGRRSDHLTQPMTLMFRMAGVDEERVRREIREHPEEFYLGLPLEEYLSIPCLAVSGFFSIVKRAKEQGRFPFDRDRILFFGLPRKGEVTVNTLRITRLSGTRSEDLTEAELELRTQLPILVDFLQKDVPGFEHAYVVETAAQVGVRETRHIQGHYTLTTQDILNRRQFPDVIAHASYPIDIHSPDGSGMQIHEIRKDNDSAYYDIPLRCLLPLGFDNMMVTGRCISAEHEASASSRISATCMALGEACGVVVADAVHHSIETLTDVPVARVQQALKQQGAFLVTS